MSAQMDMRRLRVQEEEQQQEEEDDDEGVSRTENNHVYFIPFIMSVDCVYAAVCICVHFHSFSLDVILSLLCVLLAGH